MELTLAAAALLLGTGVGYGLFRTTRRSRLLGWSLVCASLFALATRDLFRPRKRGRLGAEPSAATPNRRPDRSTSDAADADDERRRPPLLARLRSRFGGWLG